VPKTKGINCSILCLEQCRDFIRDGAEHGSSPSEVVQACDITFSCVSDPMALKDVCMTDFLLASNESVPLLPGGFFWGIVGGSEMKVVVVIVEVE